MFRLIGNLQWIFEKCIHLSKGFSPVFEEQLFVAFVADSGRNLFGRSHDGSHDICGGGRKSHTSVSPTILNSVRLASAIEIRVGGRQSGGPSVNI